MGITVRITLALLVIATTSLVPRVVAAQVQGQPTRKVYPRDDSASVPAFARFRDRLSAAAASGDLSALRAALAPTLLVNFEERTRDQALAEEGVQQGRPWIALRNALALGAVRMAYDGEVMFIAPYVGEVEPDLPDDALVITGAGVNIRQAPSLEAAVIERLSYDVVSQGSDSVFDRSVLEGGAPPSNPATWAKIVTPSGRVGYVYGEYARSETDIRFRFRAIKGEWQIVAISAGD
jgi:hypothetical protein